VLLATGAQYRRLPVDDLPEYEGLSIFYAAGPPEAQLCGASRVGVVGGGNSAGQAAVWLARGSVSRWRPGCSEPGLQRSPS
jgi:thioredoxin reductase (NADPH)